MLTAGDAQEHIRHTLGSEMSSEVSHMDVVNAAGRYLCSMHPWQWLDRRATLLDLEAGLGYVRLPVGLSSLYAVRGTTSAANDIVLGGLDALHKLRLNSGTEYPWRGAVTRRVMPVRNLLRYSNAPGQSAAWAYSDGTGAVSNNSFIDPHLGTTTAATVSDSDATATSALTQTIPAHLLKDATKYAVSVELAPSPITTTTPPKSGFLVSTPSPGSGGLQTLIEIQWGSTPWQDAPTATVIGDNTGGAVALDPVPVGQGVWRFTVSGYTHQLDENYGTLRVSVQPSRAAWSADSGTADVTQTGTVAFIRAWAHEGVLPFDYEETASALTVPQRAEPVLEVNPTPTTTSIGALSALYRADWGEATDDDDELTLPYEGWLDTLYIQIVRAYARGWEEETMGTLDARLAQIESGPIALRAKQRDGMIQPSVGQIKNGAWAMAKRHGPDVPFDTSYANISPTA